MGLGYWLLLASHSHLEYSSENNAYLPKKQEVAKGFLLLL